MCLGTIGRITGVGPESLVRVRTGDREITASLLAVSETVGPGDWVVLHSGLVLARLTEQEAKDALELREPTREGAS
jgi:hydrogenase expression/formation protein HypC